jgi:hypothetical protein
MLDQILEKLTDEEVAYLRVEAECGKYFTECLAETADSHLRLREVEFLDDLNEAIGSAFEDGEDCIDNEPIEEFGAMWFPDGGYWKS